MAYEVVMSYHLHMPSYFLGTFTEYPGDTCRTDEVPAAGQYVFLLWGNGFCILSSGRLCGRKDYKVSLISLSSTSLFTMA